MPNTWILIAHRAEARLYENAGPGKGLTPVEALEHEAGRAQGQEVITDRPGRSGAGRRVARVEAPEEVEAERFAHQLAEALQRGRLDDAYERLVVVAEPKMLGMILDELDEPTERKLRGTLSKDLVGSDGAQLERQVGEIVAV